jgi:hypothetical protein
MEVRRLHTSNGSRCARFRSRYVIGSAKRVLRNPMLPILGSRNDSVHRPLAVSDEAWPVKVHGVEGLLSVNLHTGDVSYTPSGVRTWLVAARASAIAQLTLASTGLCRHLPGACVWAPSGGSCRCDLKLQQQQQQQQQQRNHDSSAAVTQTVICTAAGALQQSMTAASFQAASSLQRQ